MNTAIPMHPALNSVLKMPITIVGGNAALVRSCVGVCHEITPLYKGIKRYVVKEASKYSRYPANPTRVAKYTGNNLRYLVTAIMIKG